MILLPVVSTWASIQGHRVLVQIIPNPLQEFWDIWELRALVVISLLSQIILLFVAKCRKYRRDIWLRVLVWSAYMIADWVPTFAMGAISSKVGDYFDKSGQQNNDMDPQLIAFWAPFFLIHLAGPHTITAYALEDSELWLRHVVSLVSQSLMTCYIILLSWKSSTSWLSYLSFPMLIIGILKYRDRIWCLYSCRINHLRDSLLTPVGDPNKDHGTRVNRLFEGMELLVSMSTDVILSKRDLSRIRGYYRSSSYDNVFLTISTDLDNMYDALYTKEPLLDDHFGLIALIINVLGPIVMFVLYIVYMGSHSYSLMDHIITLLLLIHVMSDFIVHPKLMLFTLKCTGPCFALLFLCFHTTRSKPEKRRDLLEQCNFLTLIWREEGNHSGNYFLSILKKVQLLYQKIMNREAIHCYDSNDLQKMVFDYFKKKSESNLSDMPSHGYRDIILSKMKLEVSSSTLEFHKTIIAWHIATELFFFSHAESDRNHHLLRETKNLSDYMLFLLLKRRYMLPVGAGLITMRDTVSEAKEFFLQKPEKYTEAEAANMLLDELDMLAQKQSAHEEDVLIEACKIAKQLLGENKEEMRELLSELWVEIVGYAAALCKVDNHAQQLRRGGEFLTKVWLLQARFSLLDQFHHLTLEDKPGIP